MSCVLRRFAQLCATTPLPTYCRLSRPVRCGFLPSFRYVVASIGEGYTRHLRLAAPLACPLGKATMAHYYTVPCLLRLYSATLRQATTRAAQRPRGGAALVARLPSVWQTPTSLPALLAAQLCSAALYPTCCRLLRCTCGELLPTFRYMAASIGMV